MAKIFLFDAMFQIYRAFHALPPMYSPNHIPTNVVHGVIGILSNLWKSEKIRHLAWVFDSFADNFRHGLDPEYKATRTAPPPDMLKQIPYVKEVLEIMGVATYQMEGYEADDVLATLATKAGNAGYEAIIVSNDKDLAQTCLNPSINLLRIKGVGKNTRREYIDYTQIEDFFGVSAQLIPSYLALTGDKVDNITGIPGIGPKTAIKLLKQYGPLPELLHHTLQEHREKLLLNLKLAQLCYDLPVDFSLEKLTPGAFGDLQGFYKKMGMKKHLQTLEGGLFTSPNSLLELWS